MSMFTPEEETLAAALQAFQDSHEWQGTVVSAPPTQSNLLRAKYLIEQGYVHRSWFGPMTADITALVNHYPGTERKPA